MQTESSSIRQLVEKQGIPYLIHFTRVENLPSIFEHGIYPIALCDELTEQPIVNDLVRLDDHRDANCISIAFPNYRMFFKYRTQSHDSDWAVLKLDPAILWIKKCAFCRHNAASHKIRVQPLQDLMTPAAFVGMYEEISGSPSREEQRLWSYDPTDAQAEVLVFDVIEPTHIQGVSFDKAKVRALYGHLAEQRDVRDISHGSLFFSNRSAVRDRSGYS